MSGRIAGGKAKKKIVRVALLMTEKNFLRVLSLKNVEGIVQ
jgi:hypothetical protein